jgi:hypothetical protein
MMSAAVNNTTMPSTATNAPPTLAGRLLRIGLFSFLLALLLAAAFGPLTYRGFGPAGLAAMGVALAISWVCNLLGAAPACAAVGAAACDHPKKLLGSQLLRIGLLVLLAVPITLSGLWPRRVLLLWLAGSYFALLAVETALLARWLRACPGSSPQVKP